MRLSEGWCITDGALNGFYPAITNGNVMPRGLDHIVHAVRDLDAAAELYRRLGFTVGARNPHSCGTHNQLVQLPGFFIELLTLPEPAKLRGDRVSTQFGRFNQTCLSRHAG